MSVVEGGFPPTTSPVRWLREPFACAARWSRAVPAVARARRGRLERVAPTHERGEATNREVDVAVVRAEDQTLLDQSVPVHRGGGDTASEPFGDIGGPVGSVAEVRHRGHVAPLGGRGLLEAHVEELLVELRLNDGFGGLHVGEGDR